MASVDAVFTAGPKAEEGEKQCVWWKGWWDMRRGILKAQRSLCRQEKVHPKRGWGPHLWEEGALVWEIRDRKFADGDAHTLSGAKEEFGISSLDSLKFLSEI